MLAAIQIFLNPLKNYVDSSTLFSTKGQHIINNMRPQKHLTKQLQLNDPSVPITSKEQ